MQTELRTLLRDDAGVAAAAAGGVDWDAHPQGKAKPYVVLFLISERTDYHTAGPSGLKSSRVQVDCWAKTKQLARATAAAVEQRLSGFSGLVATVRFKGIFKAGARTDFDKPGAGAEELFRESADYIVWHGAAV